jgi:phage repressor protein C with HTH and peptisase S24 domain
VNNYERIIVQSESIVKQIESIFAIFGVQMESIKEILDRLCLFYEVSNNRKLSEKIHINYNTISTWIKRDSIPYDKLHKIVQKESISFDWLLTGKGEMLLQDGNHLPIIQNKTLSEDIVSINYYPDVYAAAGYGSINEYGLEPEIMTFDKKFLEQFLNVRKLDKLDIIRVVGDSMEPFIHNGEYVILERTNQAYNGETVVANIYGQVYIKRFHADPLNRWIKLISDNKVYGDINLDTPEHIGALSIIGIVRAKIKPF